METACCVTPKAYVVSSKWCASGGKSSWTAKLLKGPELLCKKVREEAGELCQTLEAEEGPERAASEAADLLYHSLVLLNLQVWATLHRNCDTPFMEVIVRHLYYIAVRLKVQACNLSLQIASEIVSNHAIHFAGSTGIRCP